MKKIKAAFFDRDGTLIKDVNYLSSLKQIEIMPGIIDLLSNLQSQNYKLFVITNQSGVARGFFDESFVQKTHEFLTELFKSKNIFFEKFYYCPHHPDKSILKKYLIDCECRKPNIGLFLQAAKEFNIDLSESLMFGDKILDIQAGQKALCKSFYIQEILKTKDFEKGLVYE
ncbi:HAD family hydrolase [Candidatus Babeliales bacterium]|nr:HAD family hydrolase [Candidatus Babeliales bacterium]MCF7899447.1 HAD family hydrolase [Candidatus Babeliales bacterium]